MNRELTCMLCDNRCPLDALSCLKGQRFYERAEEPYCTQCDNHCLLRGLRCERGKAFYGGSDAQSGGRKAFPGLFMRFEIAAHQFEKVCGGRSSQLRVIRLLHNHGPASQGELQRILGIKAATMSELIDRMAEQGLVRRTLSRQDKRIRLLSLTESGEGRYAVQAEYEEKLNVFSALSDEEKAQLETLLGKLSADWHRRDIQAEAEAGNAAETGEAEE